MGKEQLPIMKNLKFTKKTKKHHERLGNEMKSFSEGANLEDFHNYDKSSFMCFHMTLGESTREGDLEGWWVPLRHNILSWRAMATQEPNSKFVLYVGLVSMTVDPKKDMLRAMWFGHQAFRSDIEGIYFKNMRLEIAPPFMPDHRPEAPEIPNVVLRKKYETALRSNPPHKALGWIPREKLCPAESFDSRFSAFSTACADIRVNKAACGATLVQFYPCFNHYLRSAKKEDDPGIDGLPEVVAIKHFCGELPWYYIKELASEPPWDDELDAAIKLLDFAPKKP